MADMQTLREGVRKSLPEIDMINDEELQNKVVEAWALALSETEYESIEDMPSEGVPGAPSHIKHTQADHLRGTALIALGIANF